MLENGMGFTTLKHRVNQALPRANYLTLLFLSIFRPIKRKFGFTIADLDNIWLKVFGNFFSLACFLLVSYAKCHERSI